MYNHITPSGLNHITPSGSFGIVFYNHFIYNHVTHSGLKESFRTYNLIFYNHVIPLG